MSRSQFLKAVDGLRSAGYVKATKMGSELSGCSSRMQPEPKLLEAMAQFAPSKLELAAAQGEETILMTKWHKSLHERKRERLPYDDTDQTRTFRENIGTINEVLNRHWYDLEDQTGQGEWNSDGELVHLDWTHPKLSKVDLYRRTLVRIFSNGDFGQGGRFYGGWWQLIPSKFRPFITIDGKPTCELDFRSIHTLHEGGAAIKP